MTLNSTMDRWFRRRTEDIDTERQRRGAAAWAALRTPEPAAREPDTLTGSAGSDTLQDGIGRDRIARPRHVAPQVDQLDAYQRALLDTIAGHEAPDYDVLYSPGPQLRRLPTGQDGQPDYSRHPNLPAAITTGPNRGRSSSAAGRYQILYPTWNGLAREHSDLTDFTPENQDRAAWYTGWERYSRATGGRDLGEDLRDPANYPRITNILHQEWTSLPGGVEQGQGQSEFDRRMSEGLQRHR